MSRRSRSAYGEPRRPRTRAGIWLAGPILGLAAIAALAFASLSAGPASPVASDPLAGLPDIPAALAADVGAQPAHLKLAPLPAAVRMGLVPKYSLPSIIAAGRPLAGSAAPTPTVYVAELTYLERNGKGSPVPGGKIINARPVYVLYYAGLSGFALGGRSYPRLLLTVDIVTGEQITGSGLP